MSSTEDIEMKEIGDDDEEEEVLSELDPDEGLISAKFGYVLLKFKH
jgi:hypothetical protein